MLPDTSPASFPGASPELLRMSINTGLIGSAVEQNSEQHLTAPDTLMKKAADGVFSSKYTPPKFTFLCGAVDYIKGCVHVREVLGH